MLSPGDLMVFDDIVLELGRMDSDWLLPFDQPHAVLDPGEGHPDPETYAEERLACHQAAAQHLVGNAGAVFIEQLSQEPASLYDWSFPEREHVEGTLVVRTAGEETYVPVTARFFRQLMYRPHADPATRFDQATEPVRQEAALLLETLTNRVLGGEVPYHDGEPARHGQSQKPGWPCLDLELQRTLRDTPALMDVIRALVQLPIVQLELLRRGVPRAEVPVLALTEIRRRFGVEVLSDSVSEVFGDLALLAQIDEEGMPDDMVVYVLRERPTLEND